MKRWISVLGPSGLALAMTVGCASRPARPPAELTGARAAYERAQSGPAARYNQAGLIEARQALADAERKYEDKKQEDAKTLGYAAQRKAEIAEADGRAAAATLGEAEEERETAGRAERRAKVALGRLGVAAKEEPRGTVITLPGASMFATNEAEIRPEAQKRLTQIAQAVKQVLAEQAPQDVGRKMILIGYTDDTGTEEHNLDLSKRRADAVRDFFAKHGLAADMIQTEGRGEMNPIADNTKAKGRAKNRRVEIVITRSPAAAPTESPGGGGTSP